MVTDGVLCDSAANGELAIDKCTERLACENPNKRGLHDLIK